MGATKESKDRIVRQCTKGRYLRLNVQAILDSHAGPATQYMAIGIAPAKCTVTKISVNARTYPNYATSSTFDVYKAVIGGTDVTLCTQIDVNNKTAETEIEATLTAANVDLLEGQLIYGKIVTTGVETTALANFVCRVEYTQTE